MLIEEIGFDGFRFDFVKGYGPWMVGTIAKYRYQRDGKDITPFTVGEYWEDNESIDQWLEVVNGFSDNQIAAFDFPLRYRLKDMCDTLNYDLRKLTEDGVIVAKRPTHAVTFIDNHDMQNDGVAIANDKMMAYSYILMHEGYPSIFWLDYFNFELARPGSMNGIDALINVHHKFAGGETQILHADPDLYVMQRTGFEQQPGLIFVLNNLGNQWSGTSVKTQWKNQKFVPMAWDGHDRCDIRTNGRQMRREIPSFRLRRAASRSMFRCKRNSIEYGALGPRAARICGAEWSEFCPSRFSAFLPFVHPPFRRSWQCCSLDSQLFLNLSIHLSPRSVSRGKGKAGESAQYSRPSPTSNYARCMPIGGQRIISLSGRFI